MTTLGTHRGSGGERRPVGPPDAAASPDAGASPGAGASPLPGASPDAGVPPGAVTVRAPGKINISLRVGPPRPDGFHPLVTVFQALTLGEEVTAGPAPRDTWSLRLTEPVAGVPSDDTNLAVRAAGALRDATGTVDGVALTLAKSVPPGAGMAGGSADAAATLLACDALWGTGLGADGLQRLAAEIGSDVPFTLLGGTALGTGRGEELVVLPDAGPWHWVLATQATGLSTPAVFREFDALHGYRAGGAATSVGATAVGNGPADRHQTDPFRADQHQADPHQAGPARPGELDVDPLRPGELEAAIARALADGDPYALGPLLHNDLTDAALELRPELGDVLAAFERAGALGTVLSGSGPTVVGLALDAAHAESVATVVRAAEVADRVLTTTGPARGAHLLAAPTAAHPRDGEGP